MKPLHQPIIDTCIARRFCDTGLNPMPQPQPTEAASDGTATWVSAALDQAL
jgi:hypothetical protein